VVVAAFTGITAVITYLQHRHTLAVTGWKNPIRIRRMSRLSGVELKIAVALPHPPIWAQDADRYRAVRFQLFNRSDSEQTVMFDNRKTRIRLPRRTQSSLVTTGFSVPAHVGGLVELILQGDWSERHQHELRGLCVLKVRAATTTGHTIRKRFLVSVAEPVDQRDLTR